MTVLPAGSLATDRLPVWSRRGERPAAAHSMWYDLGRVRRRSRRSTVACSSPAGRPPSGAPPPGSVSAASFRGPRCRCAPRRRGDRISTLSAPVEGAGARSVNAATTPASTRTTRATPSASIPGFWILMTTGQARGIRRLGLAGEFEGRVIARAGAGADACLARNGATVFTLAVSGVTISALSAMHANSARRLLGESACTLFTSPPIGGLFSCILTDSREADRSRVHNINGRQRAIRVVHRPPVSAGASPAILDFPGLLVLDHRRRRRRDGAGRGACAHDWPAGRAPEPDPRVPGPHLRLEDRQPRGLRVGGGAPP